MAEALRAERRLCEILPVAGMARSSYGYARNVQTEGETEEHAAARKAAIGASGASGGTYGCRRIAAVADIGERTVRDIMRDEGFSGRLKTEFFHVCGWAWVTLGEFMGMLDVCLRWYRDARIQGGLDYRSPMQYRRDLGLPAAQDGFGPRFPLQPLYTKLEFTLAAYSICIPAMLVPG